MARGAGDANRPRARCRRISAGSGCAEAESPTTDRRSHFSRGPRWVVQARAVGRTEDRLRETGAT